MGKGCDLEGDSRLLRDLAVPYLYLISSSGSSQSLSLWGSAHAQSLGWAPWAVIGAQLPQL